jgi:hypothetical protein
MLVQQFSCTSGLEVKPLLGLLNLLVTFVWDAIQTHAASDEGKQQLTEILDYVDTKIVDIPFYEPSEGAVQQSGNVGDFGSEETTDKRASTFRDRHPELFKEGEQ